MVKENRKFKRYVFPNEAKVSSSMLLENGGGCVDAKVLNISRGGVGLAIQRGDFGPIQAGAELQFEAVTEGNGFDVLLGKEVRVQWVLDQSGLENIGLGCEFINLDEREEEQLSKLLQNY